MSDVRSTGYAYESGNMLMPAYLLAHEARFSKQRQVERNKLDKYADVVGRLGFHRGHIHVRNPSYSTMSWGVRPQSYRWSFRRSEVETDVRYFSYEDLEFMGVLAKYWGMRVTPEIIIHTADIPYSVSVKPEDYLIQSCGGVVRTIINNCKTNGSALCACQTVAMTKDYSYGNAVYVRLRLSDSIGYYGVKITVGCNLCGWESSKDEAMLRLGEKHTNGNTPNFGPV